MRAVDFLKHHGSSTPDKTAIIELPSYRSLTYRALDDRADRIASYLKNLGIDKGDRVGFLAANSLDILAVVFATWRLGGVVLALNFRLTAHELSFIVNDATPKVVFADTENWPTVEKMKDSTEVASWVSFDGQGKADEFEVEIAKQTPLQSESDWRCDELCMLMYSSGTTGKPKGAQINRGMLQSSAQAGSGPGRSSRDSVSLAVMPLFHIAAMNVSCLPTIAVGATCVVMRQFETDPVLNAINDPDLGVTHFFAVPAAFNAMRASPLAETTDFSRMITVVSGAETVPPPLVQWWHDKGVCLQEGYGLTETAGQGCLLAHEDVVEKNGSAGKPLMHSTMKIMREDSTEANVDEHGEIWIRGNVVTPGYWNRPDATQEAFVGDWFRTGDIGRKDEQGYFYIEDRLKDMYISGGENVYPAEIEGVLYALPAVREVAIIGVPHDVWGETGCAVVALNDGANLSLDDIRKFCDGKLATYKQPGRMEFVELLPRNGTGKVLKFELRKRFG